MDGWRDAPTPLHSRPHPNAATTSHQPLTASHQPPTITSSDGGGRLAQPQNCGPLCEVRQDVLHALRGQVSGRPGCMRWGRGSGAGRGAGIRAALDLERRGRTHAHRHLMRGQGRGGKPSGRACWAACRGVCAPASHTRPGEQRALERQPGCRVTWQLTQPAGLDLTHA